MNRGQSLQDPFLNALRKERVPVSIYLVNGIKLLCCSRTPSARCFTSMLFPRLCRHVTCASQAAKSRVVLLNLVMPEAERNLTGLLFVRTP